MRRDLAMVALTLICAACQRTGEEVAAPPVRMGTTDLTIGGEQETREDYSFSAVSGLAFAPDGRLVVTDLKENVVRVFATAWTFADER